MKTTIVYFILLVLINNNAISQDFSKEYRGTTQIFQEYYALEATSTDYKTVFTTAEVISGLPKISVRLVHSALDGSIQKITRFQPLDTLYHIESAQMVMLPNGNQIISGLYYINGTLWFPYIMSISPTGTINWAKKINTNSTIPIVLKLLADNSMLMTFGYENASNQNHLIYCKLDADGNASSFKELNLMYEHISSLIPNNNSTFDVLLIGGHLLNINNDLSAINWQRQYYNEFGNLFNKTANGDYLIGSVQTTYGHGTIIRTDSAGNFIWAKHIAAFQGLGLTPFMDLSFHFIQENSAGNIIIGKRRLQVNSSLNVVLDANGNYISNHTPSTIDNKVKVLNSDEYLLGAFTYNPNDAEVILEKRNLATRYPCDDTLTVIVSNGTAMELTPNLITLTPTDSFVLEDIVITSYNETVPVFDNCAMFLSANEITEEQLLLENNLNVYPNPTNGMVYIEAEQPILQIKLYNTLGEILEISSQASIDLSNYTVGIYYLEVQLGKERVVQKIIKN